MLLILPLLNCQIDCFSWITLSMEVRSELMDYLRIFFIPVMDRINIESNILYTSFGINIAK